MAAKFTVGSIASINGEDFQVVRYQRNEGKHEVLLQHAVHSKRQVSIPLSLLELECSDEASRAAPGRVHENNK